MRKSRLREGKAWAGSDLEDNVIWSRKKYRNGNTGSLLSILSNSQEEAGSQ